MSRYATQAGFSAVELLITLFVAAVFLAASHQMYNAIIQDSGEVRQRTRASNIAYEYLHKKIADAPALCTASTPVNNVPVTADGLTNVVVTVTYSCPQAGLSNLVKVQSTVRYGVDSQEVVHAMYASR